MSREEFYQTYEKGDLSFVEVENDYYNNLVALEEYYFSICVIFSEAVRLAPTKKAKKQSKKFFDMFENVLKNCNLYDCYLEWKEDNPDYEAILKGTVFSDE